jgi:phosphate transport system substrate-binding protein
VIRAAAAKFRAVARRNLGHLALVLLVGPALAQDITLTSRDGALSVAGQFISYDGDVFRIDSDVGPLTINADSVTCDGPACPDLTAPKALIRITGDMLAGSALLPGLIDAFARARGLVLQGAPAGGALLLQPGTGQVLAEFTFAPLPPEAARSAMADATADLVVARFVPLDTSARILAMDALVPIVSPDNPIPHVTTADLAAALSGDVTNWSQIGGPDMPIVLHGLDAGSDLSAALAARLGDDLAAGQVHADMAALDAAVARDPWALAVTGRANAKAARLLPLLDSCGFRQNPTPLAVQTDDYPLTLPVYLLSPQRRLPRMAQEFLDFLSYPQAQIAVSKAGFVARNLQFTPLIADGIRLSNAIKAAPDMSTLPLLQRLVRAMEGAERASVTFRFESGTADLDLASTDALSELAQTIAAGLMADRKLYLVGFVSGRGDPNGEDADSLQLAETVLAQLKLLAPDLPAEDWPSIDGFGAAMPLACDTTEAGKRLNRRVELWVRTMPMATLQPL